MNGPCSPGDLLLDYVAETIATVFEVKPSLVAWNKGHKYFDARSTKASPVWFMVDIAFVERFAYTVPLATLKTTPGLGKMMVTQKGSRLSVQPVTKAESDIVVRLGCRTARSAG